MNFDYLIIIFLQEANTLLAGKRGHVHLKNLQKMLRMRQQYMTTQVSVLYPVKASLGQASGENSHSCSEGSKSGKEILYCFSVGFSCKGKFSFKFR